MGRWNKYSIALIICVLLFLTLGYFVVQPDVRSYPSYVSFSPDLDGTKAFADLLDEQEYPIKEWRQNWRFLPDQEQHALLVIQPFSISEGEQQMLLEWIAQGNDLLLFDEQPDGWEFDLQFTRPREKGMLSEIQMNGDIGQRSFTGEVGTSYRLKETTHAEVLFYDDQGPLAIQQSIGRGSLTLFLTPDWLTNESILEHDHFEMIWPFFQKEWHAIWVDEYHHGYQSKSGIFAVYPDALPIFGLQLIFALLLWLWWKGKRFGPVYTPREWVTRRSDETLVAIASWYEKQKLNKEALFLQETYLRQLIALRWGLPADTSDEAIVKSAEKHWNSEYVRRLRQTLTRLKAVRHEPHYKTKPFLTDSRALRMIIKKLEME